MASTRNKNTKEDYLLEQNMNKGRESYIHFTNSSSGKAYDDKKNLVRKMRNFK